MKVLSYDNISYHGDHCENLSPHSRDCCHPKIIILRFGVNVHGVDLSTNMVDIAIDYRSEMEAAVKHRYALQSIRTSYTGWCPRINRTFEVAETFGHNMIFD